MAQRSMLEVFKASLAAGCSDVSLPMSMLYRQRDLEALESAIDWDTADPIDVAADALDKLCTPDGWAMDRAVIYGVIVFLDKMLGKPSNPEGEMRLRALAEIVKWPSQRAQYVRWAETYYDRRPAC